MLFSFSDDVFVCVEVFLCMGVSIKPGQQSGVKPGEKPGEHQSDKTRWNARWKQRRQNVEHLVTKTGEQTNIMASNLHAVCRQQLMAAAALIATIAADKGMSGGRETGSKNIPLTINWSQQYFKI